MSQDGLYFNEIESFAAAWLRNLYPGGQVDERSIADVPAAETVSYRRCHFFAGIGGWEYALQLVGWPAERPVWTGSCPCQPFSCAGRQRGEDDPRHLWPAFRRLIAECHPATVFGEQVASRAGREWLAGVRADLEGMGYAVGAADLCAAGAGAPHIRQRLFWVANSSGAGLEERQEQPARAERAATERGGMSGGVGDSSQRPVGNIRRVSGDAEGTQGHVRGEQVQQPCGSGGHRGLANPERGGREGTDLSVRQLQQGEAPAIQRGASPWDAFDLVLCRDGKLRRIEPGSCPLAHGVPARVGRLRGYGNAIVPQVAAIFIRAFLEAEADLGEETT